MAVSLFRTPVQPSTTSTRTVNGAKELPFTDRNRTFDGIHQFRVPLKEEYTPLSDDLLSLILKLAPEYTMSSVLSWIPTVACGVLHRLYKERPNSTLMFADFDWLPPPELTKEQGEKQRTSIWAPGEPIVTDMDGTLADTIICRRRSLHGFFTPMHTLNYYTFHVVLL